MRLYKLIQEPKFATLKHLLETDMTEETLNDKLVRDIIHASFLVGGERFAVSVGDLGREVLFAVSLSSGLNS